MEKDPHSSLSGRQPLLRLISAITLAQAQMVGSEDRAELFNDLLTALLELTGSEHGFIGEVLRTEAKEPYLKTSAISNISWDEATQRFFEVHAPEGLEFFNLKTLFGAVMVTGEPVLSNDPKNDPRAGGLPQGHPPLLSFMGLPLNSGGQMVGMLGVANRPGGYDEKLVADLEPFLLTCANSIAFFRSERSRGEAEASLQESEARVRAILDSAVDAIITIDGHGIIREVNPATARIFGYSPDEMTGRNVSMLMPEPFRSRHDRYIRSYLETGKAKVIGLGREAVGLRKDGSTFPMDLAVGEVRLGDRRLFTGIIRDITERKAAVTRLEDTLVDLEKSRDDLLAILNQLRIGTLMIDSEDRITFVSDVCGCIEGIDPASALGQRWEDALPFDRSARESFRAMLRADPEKRARMTLSWTGASGRSYWIEADIKDDPRDRSTRIVFIYDISEIHELRSRLAQSSHGQMIGSSEPMQQVYELITQVAAGDWTVMIEGETGVGKELVARAIHAGSGRKQGPFVAVNCAGLSETLLESQLFGHRRGAFTGAVADQQGLFEAASGGTLFLDEIGDVSMKLQTSLLRVIQEREVMRVGDTQTRKVDTRILVATNRDLQQEVAAGRFREDLLYRIRVARIRVPPLRERSDDIQQLVMAFLAEQRMSTGKLVTAVEAGAMQAMLSFHWPGNVRELKSSIEHAVIRCRGAVIGLADLPPEIQSGEPSPMREGRLPRARDDERSRILDALDWAEDNRARAARRLGISRATLYRRLHELGLPAKKESPSPD